MKARLLAFALTFPGAHEDHPWGDTVVKVDGKIFAFLGETTLTLKLPGSADAALAVPDAHPTAYGLGKAGWVTFPLVGAPPEPVLHDWFDESYRAVAKKRRVAELDAR